ncbi:DUF4394 domain-containing protein [Asanoa iriomotensis]|uniref:DUF4394 domain-containing protein n=1 Tax=Asanoa iriomotensis TaxID=234613 RepID=A0ABQ4C6F8_9ACTN|nr:DUF4394 domain-containing protein [Asanoa iriomotensis]GIF58016.1 hypothetical protein Air01nite_41110 [Asanoa iriomotensis]
MSGLMAGSAMADGGPQRDSYGDSWENSCHERDSWWRELTAIGRTDHDDLIMFDVNDTGGACTIGTVRLADDMKLIGIDYRVQNGKLYGVGDQGGVYALSTDDASAEKVSQLSVDLDGTYFGVDFNPAADRLRIVSDKGQNLRHNLNDNTTIKDGNLTYPPSTDAAQGITAAAYTNNDLDPDTATTLFDIDTNLDQAAVQSPANAGSLAPTGKLGVDAAVEAGLDIYSVVRQGRTVYNKAFAVLQVDDHSTLYGVNLLTGQAHEQGGFHQKVVDISLPLDEE